METKNILKSKSFWVNIISLLAGVLVLFTPEQLSGLGVTDSAHQVTALGIIGAINGTLNLILRILTSQPVDAGMVGNIITGIVNLIPKKKK